MLENQKICQQEYEQADVIILDNLNRMFPNSLGSDLGSSRVLDAFVEELWRARKTVILVHHANQSGKQFGSTQKTYALDLTLKVAKDGGNTKITPEEVRSLPEKFSKPFRIPYNDEIGLSEDWFDPEKRYQNQKNESKQRGKVELQSRAVEEKSGDDEPIIEVQEGDLEKDNPLIEEVACRSDYNETAKTAPRQRTKATESREDKKAKIRLLSSEHPELKAEEISQKLGTGFGRSTVYTLLKEIRQEDATT